MEQGMILSGDFHHEKSYRTIDIISGYLAAWAFVTVGQPLDYIKVQYQIHSKIPSLTQIYRKIGFFGFYKGASSIYLMIGTITAVQFFCFQLFCDLFSKLGWVEPNQQRNTLNLMTSGFLTGGVAALIYTPIQYAKIQCQVSPTLEKGSASLLIQLLRQQKLQGLKKLYRGLGMSMAKQTLGSALYFGGYHYMMSKMLGYERKNAPIWAQIAVGSISGVVYQIISFPFDAIKTNLQSYKKTTSQMIKQRFWTTDSFRKGFATSLIRSLITDPTNFIVYENSRNFMIQKYQNRH